jgi:hypothetical protein
MRPERAPGALGVRTTRTVQLALAARVVVPETQSPVAPVWMANSALLEVSVMAPLGCCPELVRVKVATVLGWPVTTEPSPRLAVEAKRLAADEQRPVAHVPPVAHVAPLATH